MTFLIKAFWLIIIFGVFFLFLRHHFKFGDRLRRPLLNDTSDYMVTVSRQPFEYTYVAKNRTVDVPMEDFRWVTICLNQPHVTELRLQWVSSILEHNYNIPLPNEVKLTDRRVSIPIVLHFNAEELKYGKTHRIYEHVFLTIYVGETYLGTYKITVWYDSTQCKLIKAT